MQATANAATKQIEPASKPVLPKCARTICEIPKWLHFPVPGSRKVAAASKSSKSNPIQMASRHGPARVSMANQFAITKLKALKTWKQVIWLCCKSASQIWLPDSLWSPTICTNRRRRPSGAEWKVEDATSLCILRKYLSISILYRMVILILKSQVIGLIKIRKIWYSIIRRLARTLARH